MKKCFMFAQLFFLSLMLPTYVFSAPNVPQNVNATALSQTAVKVTWTGDADADGYYVYWGTSSTNLDQKEQVGQSIRQFTITGLSAGTTYWVAVSAFDSISGETSKSNADEVTTQSDTLKPATPTGFDITSINDIAEDSVTLKWNKNTETDLDHYTIYYGTTSGSLNSSEDTEDKDETSLEITGLDPSTRYFFAITAVDTSDNESDKSYELIVDTLEDDIPPYAPDCSGELSGVNAITVRISDVNSHMVDYDGSIIYYGSSPGATTQFIDIGTDESHVFNNLAEGSTWYFSALAYDIHDNRSAKSPEVSVKVEGTNSFLNQGDKFDGGCFIQTSACHLDTSKWLWLPVLIIGMMMLRDFSHRIRKAAFCIIILLLFTAANAIAEESPATKDNLIGISAGYFMPAKSNFEDYYDESVFPVFGFYERRIYKFLSADFEGGYLKEDGNLMTVSGDKTEIGSELTMIPVSASLKVNKQIVPYIIGYIGVGPDYWYCREKIEAEVENDNIEEWVGGFHAKLGFKLLNMDEQFKNTGAVVECVYSKIDRFGSNDLDIGGLMVKLGFFYQF